MIIIIKLSVSVSDLRDLNIYKFLSYRNENEKKKDDIFTSMCV